MSCFQRLLKSAALPAAFAISLFASGTSLATELFLQPLQLDSALLAILVGAICVLVFFALFTFLTASTRKAFGIDGKTTPVQYRKTVSEFFPVYVSLVLLGLGLSVVVGLLSLIISLMVSVPETTFAVGVVAFTLIFLLIPVFATLMVGHMLFHSGTKALFSKAPSLLKRNYFPLFLVNTITCALGFGNLAITSLIPDASLQLIISHTLFIIIGTVWLLVSTSIVAVKSPKEPESPELPLRQNQDKFRIPKGLSQLGQKGTACILAALLSFSLMSVPALAYAVGNDFPIPPSGIKQPTSANPGIDAPMPPDPAATEPLPYYEGETQEGELVFADDESVTYQTGEKTFETVIGGVDVAYVDEEGILQEIDNTLTISDNEPDRLENAANSFSASIPQIIDSQNGIRIEKDGKSIELIPQSGDFTHSFAKENAIRYTEVLPGIDYQYTLVGTLIKEDIVITRETEVPAFETEIKHSNSFEVKEEDGKVTIWDDSGDSDPFVTITAPVMIDASGEISDALTLSHERTSDMRDVITLKVDTEWLKSADRAYPVRIDPAIDVAPSAVAVSCVEQAWPDVFVGENGYAYVGYDDGIKSGTGSYNHGIGHWMTRTYASINYDFASIMQEARIDSATFSLHQRTAYSNGATNFGLFRVTSPWSFSGLTWNSQLSLSHEAVQYKYANAYGGYIDWDVREVVNNWVQGVYPQYGFVVKAEDERWMQCEVFDNRYSAAPPKLTINWEVPDPVDEGHPIDSTTVNLRTITEKNIDGKLAFDAVFADGIATPRSLVFYRLMPGGDLYGAPASRSYKYPDTADWVSTFPNGTMYKDKLSNWQSTYFATLDQDKVYFVEAYAYLAGITGQTQKSDSFLVYEAKQKDTLPYIANYYGVPLNTLIQDNKVQDTLVIDKNTLFIRNPKTDIPYNPPPLTDEKKKKIDSALMGRGKHCEYGFEPINLNTGNFWMESNDISISDLDGDFAITRSYNSKGEAYQSLFGRNWEFSYAESLSAEVDGTIIYFKGDGKILYFEEDGSGGYVSPEGFFLDLKKIPYDSNGETLYRYEIHEASGACRSFNAWGLLTDIYSSKGLKTEIGYDENFKITSITSPSGKVFGISTDEHGRISKIMVPGGGTMSYAYDAFGNLVSYTDLNGQEIRYAYDASHLMTEWYDKCGNRVIENIYDSEGRVTSQTDARGGVVTLSYSPGKTITTDAMGNVTEYYYDSLFRTTKIVRADGEVEEFSYGSNNTRAADNEGDYTYNDSGNVIGITAVDGSITTADYNVKGQPISITEAGGNTSSYSYDGFGNLVLITHPDSTTEAFTYDSLHRVESYTDKNGNSTSYTWEGANRTSMTDALGNTTHYSYNALGKLTSETNALGETTRYMYDAAGNIQGIQDAAGAFTSYGLDAAGNIISITDAKGYTTSITLDSAYNPISAVDALGYSLSYTYDANNNQLSETNAKGETTAFSYDSRNRVIKVTDPDGGYEIYTYDNHDNVTSTTDALGNTITTVYEPVQNMPISYTDELGNTTTFEYSPDGEVTRIIHPDSSIKTFEYDVLGQPIHIIDELGKETFISYSSMGDITAIKDDGSLTSYAYNELRQRIAETDALGNKTHNTYDSAGRLLQMTDALNEQTSYTYDARGRLLSETDARGNAVRYSYDEIGNLISKVDKRGNATEITYDALSQVISFKEPTGGNTTFSYDEAGNLILTVDALGRETRLDYNGRRLPLAVTDALGNVTTFDYDLAGNMTKRTLPTGDEEFFTYDEKSQMKGYTDAAGLKAQYSYDVFGNMTSAHDSTGRSESYDYDALGNLNHAIDTLGRKASYKRDLKGNLIEETSFEGATTTYSYDALGRLKEKRDALGAHFEYDYDAVGNLASASDLVKKSKTEFVYDAIGNTKEVTDALGNTTTYTYDESSNLTGITDAEGNSEFITYDEADRPIEVRDALGNATAYEFDLLDNMIKITRPEGDSTEYLYDELGRLSKYMNALGYVTEFKYDALGNMETMIDAAGEKTTYTYDLHGITTSETDPLGNTTIYDVALDGTLSQVTNPDGTSYSYDYDFSGRITGITTPKGYTRNFTYGKNGQIESEIDNLGRASTFSYDALGNLVRAIDAKGGNETFTYDHLSNLLSTTDALGNTTSFAYDVLDRIVSVTDKTGKTSKFAYDKVGNLIEEITPKGSKTSYTYDATGNITEMIDANGHKSTYGYDGNGRLTDTTDANGNTTKLQYDELDRVISTIDETGATVDYAFDALGNLIMQKDQVDGETHYSYDAAQRLTSVEDSSGNITAFGYDSVGNMIESIDALGNATKYEYDEEGNLVNITSPGGATESFEYDVASRLVKAIDPDKSQTFYNYDELNRLAEISYSENSTQTVLFSYDAAGQKTGRLDDTGNASYTYDEAGRITSETDGSGRTLSYSYDADGNLTSITYPDQSTVTYTYDRAGNILSVSDKNGVYTYTYDALNRPTTLSRPDGSSTGYTYDERSSVASVVNKDIKGKIVSSYSYTYDARGFIATEESTNTLVDGSVDKVKRSFLYSETGLLSGYSESTVEGECTISYIHDASGNRTEMIIQGAGKDETVRYRYDSDHRLVESNSSLSGKTIYLYDANGNLVYEKNDSDKERTYEYSVDERLTAVREGGALLMAASYDGEGNRVFQLNRYHTKEKRYTPYSHGLPGTSSESGNLPESKKDNKKETSPTTEKDPGAIAFDPPGFPHPESQDPFNAFIYGFMKCATLISVSPNPALLSVASGFLNLGTGLIPGEDDHPTRSYPELDREALKQAGLEDDEIDEILSRLSKDSVASRSGVIPYNYTAINYELSHYVNSSNAEYTQVLAEYGASGVLKANHSYGLGRVSTTSPANSANYLTDGRGSVTGVLDSSSSLTASYAYDPFGNVTKGATGEIPFFGFNQEEYNPETGLQYLRERYYDTSTGRFPTQDDYLGDIQNPLTLNRYLYALANPLAYIDPAGMASITAGITKTIGKVVNTIATAVTKTVSSYVAYSVDVARGVPPVVAQAKQVINSGLKNHTKSFAQTFVEMVTKRYRDIACREAPELDSPNIGKTSGIGFKSSTEYSELGHTILDVGGMIPGPVGIALDVVNGIWYLSEGDLENAGWSFASAAPIAGDAVAGARLANKGVNAITGLTKGSDEALDAGKAIGKGTADYKTKKKVEGKQKDDIPERFKGEKPLVGESGKDAAKRVLEEFGEYDPGRTGPGSDYNKLKKYFDTHFE